MLFRSREAQFAICGQDIDSEDSLAFQYLAITRTGSGEFVETTGVPESTSEFFFNKPRAVNFAYTGSEVINSSTSKASTIGLFEWKPRGNVFRDQNTLIFSATDGKGVEGVRTCLGNLASTTSLVGSYAFEGDSLKAVDLAGGNDGILTKEVKRAPGTTGQSLLFDGQGARVDIGGNLSLTGAFTFEFWMRAEPDVSNNLKEGALLIKIGRAHV